MKVIRWLAARPRGFWLVVISLAFTAWSLVYIYRSSLIASDGQRYFILIDDSMISMRYAWNLTHGRGLVWNAEVRVEGITNLLMTLYMAIWAALFSKSLAVLMVQISGIGFMLGLAYFTMKVAEEVFADWLEDRPFYLVLIFALSLSYYPLLFWTLFGMETGLMGLLLTAALWVAIRARHRAGWQPWLGVLLGLAFLTRPDALIVGGIIYLYRLWTIDDRSQMVGTASREIGVWALFIVGVTGFRWLYYGALVPNTYFLKVGNIPPGMRVLNGLDYSRGFLYPLLMPLIVSMLGAAISFSREKLLLAGIFAGSLLYVIWVGGDGVGSYPRMVVPLMPLAMILFVEAVASRGQMRHAVVVGLAGMLVLMANQGLMDYILLQKQESIREVARVNINMALALDAVTEDDATTAVFWAGTLPYYLDRKAVDLYGVSDAYIAHLDPSFKNEGPRWEYLPGHNKYDFAYSIDTLRPTFVEPWPSIMGWIVEESEAGSAYQLFEYQGAILMLDTESESVRFDTEGLVPYAGDP